MPSRHAEPGREVLDSRAAIQSAILDDEAGRTLDGCPGPVPRRAEWCRLWAATQARAEPRHLRSRRTRQELDVAPEGKPDRTNAAAVNARRPDADEEPAVKGRVAAQPRFLPGLVVRVVHSASIHDARARKRMRSDPGEQAAALLDYTWLRGREAEPVQDQSRMTAGEWGLLVLLSVLWGGSFFFSKIIVQEVPPFTLVLVRFTLAAGVLGAYLKAQRMPVPWSAATWAAFAGMGALNNLIPAALIAWSQQTIASGLASVLIATTPVFSILVAHCFTTDDRMSASKAVGVALGVAGVAALASIPFS